MRYDGQATMEPATLHEEAGSTEEINHNIHVLKHLMSQLDVIRRNVRSFQENESDRVPKEVVRFHTRKDLIQTERQIKTAIEGIFGEQSLELRKHQHLRVGIGSSTGIPAAIRSLEDLVFQLEGKRERLLEGYGRREDHMPDLDPLTDLYTRRLLYRYFGHELDRSRRQSYSLVLVYFALRNWQDIATRHGQRVWEEVLVGMACACKASLRGYDYGSRISEHEFALLLPQTETQGAHGMIRRIVEQFNCVTQRLAPRLRVVLEFGTAAFPFDGDTLPELFDTATAHRLSLTEDLKAIRMVTQP